MGGVGLGSGKWYLDARKDRSELADFRTAERVLHHFSEQELHKIYRNYVSKVVLRIEEGLDALRKNKGYTDLSQIPQAEYYDVVRRAQEQLKHDPDVKFVLDLKVDGTRRPMLLEDAADRFLAVAHGGTLYPRENTVAKKLREELVPFYIKGNGPVLLFQEPELAIPFNPAIDQGRLQVGLQDRLTYGMQPIELQKNLTAKNERGLQVSLVGPGYWTHSEYLSRNPGVYVKNLIGKAAERHKTVHSSLNDLLKEASPAMGPDELRILLKEKGPGIGMLSEEFGSYPNITGEPEMTFQGLQAANERVRKEILRLEALLK